MRIRSIKPEFWRSDDIAALPWEDRLLFIGLWSYVDDNGVGRDDERIITAELFALDGALTEASVRIHDGLHRLETAGLIVRYSINGRRLIHISTWSKHQKINRPSPGRFPLPEPTSTPIHVGLTEPSVKPHEPSRPGAVEQGNRGTEDSATRGNENPTPHTTEIEPADPPTAQTLVAEWIDHCGARPPGNVIGQIAKHVATMLDEGIPYPDIRRGLIAWQTKGLHPATLPSCVHEARTPRNGASRKQAETDDLFDRAMARAAQRDSQELQA